MLLVRHKVQILAADFIVGLHLQKKSLMKNVEESLNDRSVRFAFVIVPVKEIVRQE